MKKILNVGCGQGAKTKELSQRGEVTGIDISEKALRDARKAFPNSKFLNMNAERMSFPRNYFDEVHCYDVLEHVDNFDKVMSELSRVIKRTGCLVAEFPYAPSEKLLSAVNPGYPRQAHHKRVFHLDSTVNVLNSSGFKIKKIEHKKFFENLYLTYYFLFGSTIQNQQGALSTPKTGEENGEAIRCLLLLTDHSPAVVKQLMGPKLLKFTEAKTGVSLENAEILAKLFDGLGSTLFPKTIRLECTYTGKKESQNLKKIPVKKIRVLNILDDVLEKEKAILFESLKDKQKRIDDLESELIRIRSSREYRLLMKMNKLNKLFD